MKLIKHIINIMFLWSIPYMLVAFFLLTTWFSFSYTEAVTSGVFVAVQFFYSLITFIMYGVLSEDNDESISLLKTN
jgi:hypothetical protein